MKSAAWTIRRRQHRSVGVTMIFGLAVLLSAILLMGLHAPPAYANGDTLYVDWATGADTGNCRNPTAPAATIGYALTQAGEDGDEIYVAEGTYIETLGIHRTVTLRGGYEAAGWARDVAAHPTIIDANGADNSVITIYPGAVVTVEGFTIQGANHVSDYGGGFAIYGGNAIISDTVIRDNLTNNSGGGIWVEMDSNVSLINCTITGNVANGGGSGLSACCGDVHVMMRDTMFSENTGESVLSLNDGVTFEIIGGQVASNILPGAGRQSIVIGGSGTISGTAILSNTLGAISVSDTGIVSAQNLTIQGNNWGIMNSGVLTITNSIIEDNSGDDYWAVVGSANEGSPETNRLVMDGCTIRGNETPQTVGVFTGYAEIRDTKIVDNVATGGMAVIMIGEAGLTPILEMVNVLLADNESQGTPVLYDVAGSVVLMNVTIAGNNTGDNHILVNGGGVIDATNIILWGNTTTAEDMIGSPPEITTVSYSDIERGWAGTGNLDADPFFADAASGDYRLGARSPCIDRGTATDAPTGDIEGTLRDGFPDMGAYEWTGLRIFLPLAIKK